ncbi:VWA domain-containing protein [Octadecabacter sp. R77987]|uniref:vWA domain-containing protein n=1 Tax=Octadecabacter sp. R77987 TaxID=3093874 RepID=UPI00366B67DC
MMRLITLLFALLLLPVTLAAQDRPNTILVMDGSGSMWGQIDGVAKITIAQDVVTDLLQTLPADQRLGLTVYGHRERGNCTDIETVVAPDLDTRDAIAQAVANIQPLGKTPMTDAVIAAANALRYTEDSATVILVSDGVETCNPDPCAAARLLEEAGINFTAHVIGFDISDAEALGQMQCIADETGGTFRTARDADELAAALDIITQEPEIITVNGTFRATIGEGGLSITDDVLWTVSNDAGVVVQDLQGNPINIDLLEGSYRATATWVVQEMTQDATFTVSGAGDVTVTIPFDIPLPDATVSGPATALIGDTVPVQWSGPNEDNDYIAVSIPGERGYETYSYTKDGSPLDLQMPATPGTYELRYVRSQGSEVLAIGDPFDVTPVDVTIMAPDTAPVGATIDIGWTGPDYRNDYIAVARIGDTGYENYGYTARGNPTQVDMPTEPGDYELRYVMSQQSTVIATRPITVTDIAVSVSGPATATAGASVPVEWVGPDYDNDYIAVAEIGERGYINYTYTKDGSPLMLQMPVAPGDYELRYVLSQDSEVIATAPIAVTALSVTLDAPETAPMGALVGVMWDGPDYDNDYVAVSQIGENGYINYTYTREGSPLMLEMPAEAGTFEIRYYLSQDSEVAASRIITTTPVEVAFMAPDTVQAGTTVDVGWMGPDYPNDYIGIGVIGETGYETYEYTRSGNPVRLDLPETPGTYEIRYFLSQDTTVIGSRLITVTD